MSKDSAQDVAISHSNFIMANEYWTHYKGGVYQVITLGVKEDTAEPCVIYRSLKYGTVWVRTLANWLEKVTLPDGTEVFRFSRGSP